MQASFQVSHRLAAVLAVDQLLESAVALVRLAVELLDHFPIAHQAAQLHHQDREMLVVQHRLAVHHLVAAVVVVQMQLVVVRRHQWLEMAEMVQLHHIQDLQSLMLAVAVAVLIQAAA
jgi:hypothetical protein